MLLLREVAIVRGSYDMCLMMTNSALHMSRALGLDRKESEEEAELLPWVETEERRRVWWYTYIYYRWTSMRRNGVLDLDESNVTTYLPAPEKVYQHMDPDVVLSPQQRLSSQKVPFNEVLACLENLAPQLDVLAILVLLARQYGFLVQHLRELR
jgi:hypothetical protein